MSSRKIKVVSTVNLPGLPAGTVTWTDPEIPYVAGCLRGGFLLPLEPYSPLAVEPVPEEPDFSTLHEVELP